MGTSSVVTNCICCSTPFSKTRKSFLPPRRIRLAHFAVLPLLAVDNFVTSGSPLTGVLACVCLFRAWPSSKHSGMNAECTMAADMSQLIIVLLVFSLMGLIFRWQRQPHAGPAQATATVQRLLRPRTPHDCPACRQQTGSLPLAAHASPPIQPWHERKSRRGAPKRIPTDGFACPNRRCSYYRMTDAHIHALVGDGTHGKQERIQTFRCQACGTTFSARRDTPLYRLKTASQRVGEVLSALAERVDIAAAARIFGQRPATITTWVTRAGDHSTTLHQRWFQGLHLSHLQLDELGTRLRCRARVLWLWVVVDPRTKIIPTLHVGSRTRD